MEQFRTALFNFMQLTYNFSPARFNEFTNAVHDEQGNVIPPGQIIGICAWCDVLKSMTNTLHLAGYKTSRGICNDCAEKEMIKLGLWNTKHEQRK